MSNIKSPWDTFSFTPSSTLPTQQPINPVTQPVNRGAFTPNNNNTFLGGRTTTNPARSFVQQNTNQGTTWQPRSTTQTVAPWQQQQVTQMHPQLYSQPGDMLPSYYEPQPFYDQHGNISHTPTTEQWLHRHAVRSAQVGVGAALIHFGEGLVQAYLPWKTK